MITRKFRKSISKTIINGIILLVFVMEIGAAAIGYVVFTDKIQGQYQDNAKMIATTVAEYIDASSLDRYLEMKGRDSQYLSTEELFQSIADNEDCAVVYIAKIDPKTKKRTYIYDVVSKESGFTPYPIGYTDDIEDDVANDYAKFLDGTKDSTHIYGKSSMIGPYVTMLVPVEHEGEVIAVCGVVKSMTSLVEGRRILLQQLLIWALIIALLAGSAGIVILRKRIVFPLRRILAETERFTENKERMVSNLAREIPLDNEIGDIAAAIDKMELTITEGVNKLLKVTAEKNRIGTELRIAQTLQSSVLPKICETFPGREEIDVYMLMNPAKEVGGDYYDCFFIDKDHFAMIIADVAGKGVPAALYMMVTKVLLKTATLQKENELDPGKILESVNRSLCENRESEMFVTVWLGILDLTNGEIRAANAGHEYPIVAHGMNPYELFKDKHGFVLGGLDGMKYESYSIQLMPGDRLFVYTDGVPEAQNNASEQFGMDRLLESLNRYPSASPEEVGNTLMEELSSFVNDASQFDDTTFLSIRYNGTYAKELTVTASVDNIPVVTDFVNEELNLIKCPENVRRQFDVVIDEIFANIAFYAYRPDEGEATVIVDLSTPGAVELTFKDHGKRFNPLEKEDPDVTLSADEREIGGLGIFISKNIMDEISYEYLDGENVLTIKKQI